MDSGQAMKCKSLLDSWGEFRCSSTGGWTPVYSKTLAMKEEYWRSQVTAIRFKVDVKHDPAFADEELSAFTPQQLDATLENLR
jgi:hypothetical protein